MRFSSKCYRTIKNINPYIILFEVKYTKITNDKIFPINVDENVAKEKGSPNKKYTIIKIITTSAPIVIFIYIYLCFEYIFLVFFSKLFLFIISFFYKYNVIIFRIFIN